MKNNLSKDMIQAIEFIKNKNGKLIYYRGGFWAEENAAMKPTYNGGVNTGDIPKDYIRTVTIKALEKRDIIEYTEFKISSYGHKYPIKLILR